MSRSTTSIGRRYDGIAMRRKPPGSGAASKIFTAYPRRASCQAAVRPAGPEPTIATFRPFGSATSMPGPSAVSSWRSEANRFRRRMGSVLSREPRVHSVSHGA